MKIPPMLFVLAGGLLVSSAQAAPASHFPRKDLGNFLATTFDLASIRSSLGPRRAPGLRTFADFGMKPSKATDDALVFETPGTWLYELKIVARRDVNGDGIEDLEVCFTDRALNGASYNASQALLITRYAADAYAVALRYEPNERACKA